MLIPAVEQSDSLFVFSYTYVYIQMSSKCTLLGFVSSQQRFGVTDIKALGASQLSGLGQTLL